MKRLRLIANESDKLEIEKLHDQEKSANQGNEYDDLYNKLEDTKTAKKEVKGDSGGDADMPTDPGAEPDEDTGTGDDQQDGEYKEAVESIRELTYAQESFGEVMSVMGDMASTLGTLGIQYSMSAVKSIFKGVLIVFIKVARLTFTSIYMLSKYLERRRNSFTNLKKSIQSLKEVLAAAQEAAEPTGEVKEQYTSVSTINTLKISDSVDLTKNVHVLGAYMDQTIRGISEQILQETNSINHILAMGRNGQYVLPKNTMTLNPEGMKLREGQVSGYEPASEYVTAYHGDTLLPGDVIMVATFPKNDLEEKADIIRGYNDSSIILGFDSRAFKEVSAVDYMTADNLTDFLNEMERLCDVCLAHETLYDKVKASKIQLKTLLKNYFSFLNHSPKKVSLNNSFMEEVYLKAMFIDKVYLTAMMDMHDYVSRVLVSGTRYAKSNIEQLA